jgi:hypothetical protein
LKNSNLDQNSPTSYRPISLLPFLSKVLEKLVAVQLVRHLSDCGLEEMFQSGFRAHHSTESALLYISNELRTSADKGRVLFLLYSIYLLPSILWTTPY